MIVPGGKTRVEMELEELWVKLYEMQKDIGRRCSSGEGSPGLRDAAEAIRIGPMVVLEQYRGRKAMDRVIYGDPTVDDDGYPVYDEDR